MVVVMKRMSSLIASASPEKKEKSTITCTYAQQTRALARLQQQKLFRASCVVLEVVVFFSEH